jgi:hypothetical protein
MDRKACLVLSPHYHSIRSGYFALLVRTAREEGIRGLARGLPVRILFYVPGSALTFAGYELAKQCARKEPGE